LTPTPIGHKRLSVGDGTPSVLGIEDDEAALDDG
jgi:hypothetical protein